MAEKIQFQTADGVTIVGDYLDAGKGAPHALLLHMMPAMRGSFHPFMEKLKENNFASLAIDLRGHGESITGKNGKILDYKKFSDREHQSTMLDVRGAVAWLEEHGGAQKDRLTIVGASIGANLALQYMSENHIVKKGVLLSPGLDYRGIKTDVCAKKISGDQRVLLVASKDDTYSFQTIHVLERLMSAQFQVYELQSGEHGTAMFSAVSTLMDDVIAWMGK